MHELGSRFEQSILRATSAEDLGVAEVIQELWGGYGRILRIRLDGGDAETVVAKHVRGPTGSSHPRGWDTDLSHRRKVRSYEVETAFYEHWSRRCGEGCRLPKTLGLERDETGEVLIVLEDLDAAGFPARLASVNWQHVEICLRWLANFHATFMGVEPVGLWKTGTYWHLETRPEELRALDDEKLRAAATEIDRKLSAARFQTLVHGDAKLANFCFAGDGQRVAAVDFQYVGGGCGMKDVAYFIGSCLDERECEAREAEVLACYFSALEEALAGSDVDARAIVDEWRGLFHIAWTDFHRFIKGWSPGHWKINSYSERVAREVCAQLAAD